MNSVEIDCVAEFEMESAIQMCLKRRKTPTKIYIDGLKQRYALHEVMDVANSQFW